MGDLDRDIKATVTVSQEGDAAAFRTAADDSRVLQETVEELEGALTASLEGVDSALAGTEESFAGMATAAGRLDDARRDVAEFARVAEKGGEDASFAGSVARISLEKLREEAARLRAEGRGLTDDHVRELEDLERTYAGATNAAGKFRRDQLEAAKGTKAVGDAAATTGGKIRTLNKAFETGLPRIADYALKGGLIVASFKFGFEAGEIFRSGLAAIDETLGTALLPSLDETISKILSLKEVTELYVGVAQGYEERIQNITNLQRVLANEGIDPTNLSLAQQYEELARVKSQQADTAAATAAADAAFQNWTKSLGLNRAELDSQVTALDGNLETLLKSGSKLDEQKLGEKLKPQIQKLLDAYLTLDEVNPVLQGIADRFGIVDSASGAMAAALERAAKSGAKSLDGLATSAAAKTAAIRAALLELPLQDLRILPPELKEEVKAELQAIEEIAALRGKSIPERLREVGSQVGAVIPEVRRPFGELKLGVEEDLGGLGSAGEEASTGVGKAAGAVSTLATSAQDLAAVDTSKLGEIAEFLERLSSIDVSGAVGGLQNLRTELAGVKGDAEAALRAVQSLAAGEELGEAA